MPISKSETTTPRRRRVGRPSGAQLPQAEPELSETAKRRMDSLNDFLGLGVAGAIFLKQYADAGAIGMHGPRITKAIAKQGDKNDRVGAILDYFSVVGPYSELIAAALPLALQIAVNHNRVTVEAAANFGVVSPGVLEAKIKLDMKQQEAAILQALQQQEAEIAQMNIAFAPPPSNGKVTEDAHSTES